MEDLWKNRSAIKKKMHKLMTGGSTAANERLDEVQSLLEEHPQHDGDENLDVLCEITEALAGVHEDENAKGDVKSTKVLKRCEDIGDSILSNLQQRITVDLFRQANGAAISNEILDLAKKLDSVRSKASDEIVAHISAAQEKAIAAHIEKMNSAMEQMKVPHQVVPSTVLFVDTVATAHAEAPDNVPASQLLLKRCSQLRETYLKLLPQALSGGEIAMAISAHDVSGKLDAIASKLATARASTWDPCVTPKVDAVIQAQGIKHCTAFMLGVRREELADKSEPLGLANIVTQLEVLRPWWRYACSGSASAVVRERLAAVLKEVDERAVEEFSAAAKAEDISTMEALLEASRGFDSCRAQFDECPSTSKQLQNLLLDTFSGLRKQIEDLEARMAGAIDLDVALLAAVMQSLEAIVPALRVAAKADASILERFSRVMDTIDARAEESLAAVGCDLPRMVELMRWSERRDSRCSRLAELGDTRIGLLAPKFRPMAATVCLRSAEAQVFRGSDVDLDVITHAMEELWKVFAADRDVIETVLDRIRTFAQQFKSSLVVRVATADQELLQKAWKCARISDGALAAGGTEAKTMAGFCDALSPMFPVCEKLNTIDAELAKTSGMNPTCVLSALEDLKGIWPAVANVDAFCDRLKGTSSLLRDRMAASFEKAMLAKNERTQTVLLKFASDYDTAFHDLGLRTTLHEILNGKVEDLKAATQLPELPTSSFAPPPRDSAPPTETKFEAGAEWGSDSPRRL